MVKKIILLNALLALFQASAFSREVVIDSVSGLEFVTNAYREMIRSAEVVDTTPGIRPMLFTKTMYDKMCRATMHCDADVVLRAQDVAKYALGSLSCRHMHGNWYVVRFRNGDKEREEVVSVKLTLEDGDMKIAYISPEWLNEEEDDSIFNIKQERVNMRSAKDFVASFYRSYTYVYSMTPGNLEQQLDSLRDRYCTPRMREQFVSAANEVMRLDRMNGYDIIVDGFDFDLHTYPYQKIEEKAQDTFVVRYATGWTKVCRNVKVLKQDGKWFIDSIEK